MSRKGKGNYPHRDYPRTPLNYTTLVPEGMLGEQDWMDKDPIGYCRSKIKTLNDLIVECEMEKRDKSSEGSRFAIKRRITHLKECKSMYLNLIAKFQLRQLEAKRKEKHDSKKHYSE